MADVKTTVKYKAKLVKLSKKCGLNIPENYGARDHFMSIMEADVSYAVKYEALNYYDKWLLAAFN